VPGPTVVDEEKRTPEEGAPARPVIVVLGRDGAYPRALPTAGELLVGRDDDADIRLVDGRASRQHARITVDGERITVIDLGSANGTRLRDASIEPNRPVPIQPGDVISIGGTMLILHRGAAELGARRVWAYGYLETRLIEECARAQSRGSELAVCRIRPAPGTPAVLAEEILSNVLRGGDLLAAYAPGEYEALLIDSGRGAAEAVSEAITAAFVAKRIVCRVGLAFLPEDGTSPQALLGRATERLEKLERTEAHDAGAGVILESSAMRELYAMAARAAAGTSNVLILGETGVGKEKLAEAVHRASPRAGKPFVAVNCAALSESVVESELFGHERGAFTGANQAKVGLIEAAAGGTLFLDEIGEMPLSIQAKLLRVIEARQVLRVGATQPRPVDIRLVAATNRDLEEEVEEKRFREDLYFRLNVITLEIPPLRERVEEIGPLARLFLGRLAEGANRPAPALSAEALAVLEDYAWPGNVRELRNVVERAFVLCTGTEIRPEHLPVEKIRRVRRKATDPSVELPAGVASGTPGEPSVDPSPPGGSPPPVRNLKELERQAILDALERCHFNQTRAAELLEMPRRTFCKRMKEYGIPRPRA
jgi:DNA-binding NtrC family response regulator